MPMNQTGFDNHCSSYSCIYRRRRWVHDLSKASLLIRISDDFGLCAALWPTSSAGTHISVCFQLSQETLPVLQVVIDSVESSTVDVSQDPLSLLRNEFFFLYCFKHKKLLEVTAATKHKIMVECRGKQNVVCPGTDYGLLGGLCTSNNDLKEDILSCMSLRSLHTCSCLLIVVTAVLFP